jgi:hypothetical protein
VIKSGFTFEPVAIIEHGREVVVFALAIAGAFDECRYGPTPFDLQALISISAAANGR